MAAAAAEVGRLAPQGLALVVHNAGIASLSAERLRKMPPQDAAAAERATVATNYWGTIAAHRALRSQVRRGGAVVFVLSDHAQLRNVRDDALRARLRGCETVDCVDAAVSTYDDALRRGAAAGMATSAYALSKAALGAAVRAEAAALNASGVRVVAVHPGYINTDHNQHRGKFPVGYAVANVLAAADAAPSGALWFDGKAMEW